MQYLIVLFGVAIVAVGLVVLVRPSPFVDYLRRYSMTTSMQVLAVAVRIVLGLALILHADQSKFPLVLEIIGWLSLAAAVTVAVIPHAQFKRLVFWVLDRFADYVWIGAIAATGFGLFLVYAVL